MGSKPNATTVVKIGGATFGSRDPILEDIVTLQQRGDPLVVVHGGGNMVTEWLSRQGAETRFVRGERVTDRPTLDMVTAVLGGLVNKQIVATINSLGGRAVGISGVDGATVRSRMRGDDMGYVGTVVEVDATLLEALLRERYVPIISPLGFHSVDRPEDAPGMLNINGDTLAGEIAAALGAERLIFLTDVAGVSDGDGKVLPHLSPDDAEVLVASGVASGGMIPKINACLKAVATTASSCIIDGRQPHALLRAIDGEEVGTMIQSQG